MNMMAPKKSGRRYYNFKGAYSLVLLALVDYNYEFTYVDVGKEGSCADGGIWRKCTLNRHIQAGDLNIPKTDLLPGTSIKMPHMIVSDEAFPLTEHIMKPYARRNLTHGQAIFNYRLSRARRISENAFGILASRFRVFLGRIFLNPDDAVDLIMAAVSLHNFLRRNFGAQYIPPGTVDVETENYDIEPGNWRDDPRLDPLVTSRYRNPKLQAKQNRETLEAYFETPMGRVPWQEIAIQNQ